MHQSQNLELKVFKVVHSNDYTENFIPKTTLLKFTTKLCCSKKMHCTIKNYLSLLVSNKSYLKPKLHIIIYIKELLLDMKP